MTWQTALLGLTLGVGLALVAAWAFARRPRLEDRVAPFVRAREDLQARRREATVTPFPTLERLLVPVLRDLAALLERWGLATTDVAARLHRAGATTTVEQFRAQQIAWGAAGLAAGCLIAVVLGAVRGAGLLPGVMVVIVATAAGVAARDLALTWAVRRRARRMLLELPTVAELLALAVAAGESAPAAVERVASTTHGAVADELRDVLAKVRAGSRLPVALGAMAEATGLAAMRRFADGVSTAIDRGTPLAEVLRAQAQDIRSASQRELLEEGGRREIAMMIPVVFLILPITVLFAVFPGLVAIDLGG